MNNPANSQLRSDPDLDDFTQRYENLKTDTSKKTDDHDSKLKIIQNKYEDAFRDQQLKKNADDIAMKKNIFQWVKILINFYLVFVACIISVKFYFSGLTPPEIIALLSSTTATIIGLPYLIVSSLFSKGEFIKKDKLTEK